MNIKIIVILLFCLTITELYATNNISSEKVNAVAIVDDVKIAVHVSFTLNIKNNEMDIQDISLTNYSKDEKTLEIKVTKETNCFYPKGFFKDERKDKALSGIIKHEQYDVREITFWCDNEVEFNAKKLIPGSKLETKLQDLPREKSNVKPLANGKPVMIYTVGYFVMTYEDVTSLGIHTLQ